MGALYWGGVIGSPYKLWAVFTFSLHCLLSFRSPPYAPRRGAHKHKHTGAGIEAGADTGEGAWAGAQRSGQMWARAGSCVK